MSESDRPQHDFSNNPTANPAESHDVNPTTDNTPDVYEHASVLIQRKQEQLQLEKQQRGSSDPWWKNLLHRKKEHPTTIKAEPISTGTNMDMNATGALHSDTASPISLSSSESFSSQSQAGSPAVEHPPFTSTNSNSEDSSLTSSSDHSTTDLSLESGNDTSSSVEEPVEQPEINSMIDTTEQLVTIETADEPHLSHPITMIRGMFSRITTSSPEPEEYTNIRNARMSRRTVLKAAAGVAGGILSSQLPQFENIATAQETEPENPKGIHSPENSNEQAANQQDTSNHIRNEFSVGESHEVEQDPVAANHTEQTVMPVDSFQDTYEKTVEAERIWGEQLTGNMREAYDYALSDKQPGQVYNHIRPVRYYSKGRMDVNPHEKEYHEWFVKSGLLVSEMINGKMQVGDTKFIDLGISKINIVGDPDAGNITYESVAKANSTDQSRLAEGEKAIKMLNQDGSVAEDQKFDKYGVTATNHVTETDHTIATPFWEFMQKDGKNYNDNPYYFTGFPISEPYWTTAQIGGQMRDVMVQAFERRTLTYTPDNIGVADDFVVEYGNAGIHYLKWRYAPKESVIGEQVNTLDYLIPDDQTKSLDGSHNLSTVYDQEKSKVYLVKGGGREINGKNVSGSYEQYKVTENGVYLEEDHSNGDDKYYSFSDGLMLKKDMKVGETIDNADNVVNFYDNNGQLEKSMPFPFKATLLANTEVYIGGDLGTQKVMVYKYDWRSNYEVFYFSEQYGWVMWELYKADGMLEHNAIFNTIVDSVTHPAPSSRE